jgi:hypothetical protein
MCTGSGDSDDDFLLADVFDVVVPDKVLGVLLPDEVLGVVVSDEASSVI